MDMTMTMTLYHLGASIRSSTTNSRAPFLAFAFSSNFPAKQSRKKGSFQTPMRSLLVTILVVLVELVLVLVLPAQSSRQLLTLFGSSSASSSVSAPAIACRNFLRSYDRAPRVYCAQFWKLAQK